MSRKSLFIHPLVTLALLFTSLPIKGTLSTFNTSTSSSRLFPVTPLEYRRVVADASGGPFQLCLLCKCCAATNPSDCSSMSCCFGISCNLPDKPYGACAFVPKTCNCTSCA